MSPSLPRLVSKPVPLTVAYALVRAASRLISTHGSCIGTSADGVRTSAYATNPA
jgi:hypothetical protein